MHINANIFDKDEQNQGYKVYIYIQFTYILNLKIKTHAAVLVAHFRILHAVYT